MPETDDKCQHVDCRVQRGEWNESIARMATFGSVPPCPEHGIFARAERLRRERGRA